MTIMIATWFVADAKGEASKFAQVSGDSSTQEFQAVYWRCVAVFFATSKMQNPSARHVFFTNTSLPIIDGLDFSEYFTKLKVETVFLPITFRLPRTVIDAWGNQFYILDIIRYLALFRLADSYLVLDSDCVWTASADRIEAAIADKSCILYTLGDDAYLPSDSINGVTRQDMAQLAAQVFPDIPTLDRLAGISYHGGEIFGSTHQACVDINHDIDSLWHQRVITANGVSGYLEEAHFLSIIYRHRQYEPYSANSFIKRMWTGFRYNNVCKEDVHFPIWHVPAEKRRGLRSLFRLIVRRQFPQDIARCNALLRGSLGVPHKRADKFVFDLGAKIIEKSRAFFAC